MTAGKFFPKRVDMSRAWCRLIYMSNAAHTLFGYTKLAHSHTRGTSGIKTGSGGGKQSGRTHLWSADTGRTACGKRRGDMSTFDVPVEVTEATWIVRISLCRTCRSHVGA